jgi:hypothetical protein
VMSTVTVSQNSTAIHVEVDVFQASPGTGRFRRTIDGTGRLPE